jgi:hypothetical protein
MREKTLPQWQSPYWLVILNYPVLMMCTNHAKCYLLILPVDLIQKSLVGKHAVISVVLLYNAICLRQNLFKGFNCKNCLINGEILHKMNIDKITNMITEHHASPNFTIC